MQLTQSQQIVFDMIVNAAERGDEFPSNHLLRAATGKSVVLITRMVAELEGAGLIRVDRTRNSRVATVLATGKRTATPYHLRLGKRPQTVALCDRLAAGVAELGTVKAAAQRMGIAQHHADRLWRKIKDGLGWQAV